MILIFSHRGRRIFLPFILALIVVLPLFSGGSKDEDAVFDSRLELEKIKTLINENRLDEAIAILVDIGQEDSNQIERVQKLVLRILEKKNYINTLFDELNNAIIAGNEIVAAERIREIQERDINPNKNTLNNLIMAAVAISKVQNNIVRDRIYEQGNRLLAEKEYTSAVKTFQTGFISDEYVEFYDEYISLAQNKTSIGRYENNPERQKKIWDAYEFLAPQGSRIIEDLNASLAVWETASVALTAQKVQLLELVESMDFKKIPEGFVKMSQIMRQNLKNIAGSDVEIERLAEVRKQVYAILDEIPEEYRYERIESFMLGRQNSRNLEGISFVQRQQWENAYFSIFNALNQQIESLIIQGRSLYGERQISNSIKKFTEILEIIALTESHLRLSQDFLNSQSSVYVDSFQQRLNESTTFQAYAAAAVPFWLELNKLVGQISDLEGVNYEEFDFDAIDTLSIPLQKNANEIVALQNRWMETLESLTDLPESNTDKIQSMENRLSGDLADALILFGDTRLFLYVNMLSSLYGKIERKAVPLLATDLNAARSTIQGAPFSEDSGEIPIRRPSWTINTILDPAELAIKQVESSLNDFLNIPPQILRREPPLDNTEPIVAFANRGNVLSQEIANFQVAIAELNAEGSVFANKALRAEAEAKNAIGKAENLIGEALSIVESNSNGRVDLFLRVINLYSATDELLNNVDELYLETLVNDVDIAKNSGIDESRTKLRRQIQEAQNQVAVVVKTNAMDAAKKAFIDGNFDLGVTVLNQSQDFWNQVYAEDDPEINAWLRRLKNGQRALQQTLLKPTDPLYADMNQYLNLANRQYANGLRRIEQSLDNDATLKIFQEAINLLKQVLITFPGNEAALLLEQKILRQTDENAWESAAREIMNESRRALNRNDIDALIGDSKKKGLYVQVKILEEIDATFPGIETLIYDMKVALGLIIPPLDPLVLAESRRHTDEARQIWTNLGLVGAEGALELLNRALVLWLENDAALQLKNEILLFSEPESLPVLPAELLSLMNLVGEYYSQNNFILAKAFLDRIANEYFRYSKDPRIREWNRKVNARL